MSFRIRNSQLTEEIGRLTAKDARGFAKGAKKCHPPYVGGYETTKSLFSSYSQRVRHAVDVVEPSSNQSDLQDRLIVKSHSAQFVVIIFPDLGGVFSNFHGVVKHRPFLRSDGSRCVIFFQSFDQILIQRNPTQKLCVRFDSIDAPVRD